MYKGHKEQFTVYHLRYFIGIFLTMQNILIRESIKILNYTESHTQYDSNISLKNDKILRLNLMEKAIKKDIMKI